jgi:hypothetical protein
VILAILLFSHFSFDISLASQRIYRYPFGTGDNKPNGCVFAECGGHTGIDQIGEFEVYAIGRGTIVKIVNSCTKKCIDCSFCNNNNCSSCSNCNFGWGNLVQIYHDEFKVYASYHHLSSVTSNIFVGKEVSKGESLGISGATGYSTNRKTIHLHFQMTNRQNVPGSGSGFGAGYYNDLKYIDDKNPQKYEYKDGFIFYNPIWFIEDYALGENYNPPSDCKTTRLADPENHKTIPLPYTFTWDRVEGVSKYRLNIYNASQGYLFSYPDTSDTSYVVSGLEAGKQYNWSVTSVCGSNPPVSGIQDFYVSSSSGGGGGDCKTTRLVDPENSKPIPLPYTFKWERVEGVSSYRINIFNASQGLLFSHDTNDTSYVISGLDAGKQYNWSVTSLCGTPKESGRQDFYVNKTEPGPILDWADFVSKYPQDDTIYQGGTKFTMQWIINNTGTTTWNRDYRFEFVKYDGISRLTNLIGISPTGKTSPGENCKISIDLEAPKAQTTEQTYSETWYFKTPAGLPIIKLVVRIRVAAQKTNPLIKPNLIWPNNGDRFVAEDLNSFAQLLNGVAVEYPDTSTLKNIALRIYIYNIEKDEVDDSGWITIFNSTGRINYYSLKTLNSWQDLNENKTNRSEYNFQWNVTARDINTGEEKASAFQVFQIYKRSKKLQAPELQFPINGASISLPYTFKWQYISGANSYRISFKQTTNQSTYNRISNTNEVTEFSTEPFFQSGNTYTWSVCAVDVNGNAQIESNLFSFTITKSGLTPNSPKVTVEPCMAYAKAQYTLETSIASSLFGNTDYFDITFPNGTYIPSIISNTSVLVGSNYLTVSPFVTSYTIRIYPPTYINANENIKIVFLTSSGIQNPSSGNYVLSLKAETSSTIGSSESYVYNICENKSFSRLEIVPYGKRIQQGQNQTFTARAYDQNGNLMSADITYYWSCGGGIGYLSNNNIQNPIFYARNLGQGNVSVQANYNSQSISASVNIVVVGDLYKIILTPGDVTTTKGKNTTFIVQSFDINDEVLSDIHYEWSLDQSIGAITLTNKNDEILFTAQRAGNCKLSVKAFQGSIIKITVSTITIRNGTNSLQFTPSRVTESYQPSDIIGPFNLYLLDESGQKYLAQKDIGVFIISSSINTRFSLDGISWSNENKLFTNINKGFSETLPFYISDLDQNNISIVASSDDLNSASIEIIIRGNKKRLRISTSPQIIKVNTPSNFIGVYLEDVYGNKQSSKKPTLISLVPSSATGQFSMYKVPWIPVTQVILPAGSNYFEVFYLDSRSGNFVLNFTSPLFGNVSQEVLINNNSSSEKRTAPQLLNPNENQSISLPFNFSWSEQPNSQNYRIIIYNESKTPQIEKFTTVPNITIFISDIPFNGKFYWSVLTNFKDATTSYESDLRLFYVQQSSNNSSDIKITINYPKSLTTIAPYLKSFSSSNNQLMGNISISGNIKPVNSKEIYVYSMTKPGIQVKISIDPNGIFNGFAELPLIAGLNAITFSVKDKQTGKEYTSSVAIIAVIEIKLNIGELKAIVNGKETKLDGASYLLNGKAMVSMRFIAESIGAYVNWQADIKKISFNFQALQVDLIIGEKKAIIIKGNEVKTILLDVAPELIDGKTFVPMEFLYEIFGATIKKGSIPGSYLISI